MRQNVDVIICMNDKIIEGSVSIPGLGTVQGTVNHPDRFLTIQDLDGETVCINKRKILWVKEKPKS